MRLHAAIMKPGITVSELFENIIGILKNTPLNGKNGKSGKNGSGKHRQKPYDRNSKKSAEDLECHYCLKLGRRARDYSIKKRAQEKQKERDERRGIQGKSASGYHAFADDTGVHGLTVSLSATAVAAIAAFKAHLYSKDLHRHNAFSATKSDDSNGWIVDSSASHQTGRPSTEISDRSRSRYRSTSLMLCHGQRKHQLPTRLRSTPKGGSPIRTRLRSLLLSPAS